MEEECGVEVDVLLDHVAPGVCVMVVMNVVVAVGPFSEFLSCDFAFFDAAV